MGRFFSKLLQKYMTKAHARGAAGNGYLAESNRNLPVSTEMPKVVPVIGNELAKDPASSKHTTVNFIAAVGSNRRKNPKSEYLRQQINSNLDSLVSKDFAESVQPTKQLFSSIELIKEKIQALPKESHEISFFDLNITVRNKNILRRKGVTTLECFLKKDSTEIASWQNFGNKSVSNLIEVVAKIEAKAKGVVGGPSLFDFYSEKKYLLTQIELSKSVTDLISCVAAEYGWLENFQHEYPLQYIELRNSGISSDLKYIVKREGLENELLQLADTFRFELLSEQVDLSDPLKVLEIAPLWLINLEVTYFECTVRIKNVIQHYEIATLGGFFQYSSVELSRLKNMGRKSIKDLASYMIKAYGKGRPPTNASEALSDKTLFENFFDSLEKISNETHRIIIEKRLGVHGNVRTLEELGREFNVTRERIRQIQQATISAIIDGEFWDDLLYFKVKELVKNPAGPIFLDTLDKHDTWFSGFQEHVTLLTGIVSHFSHLELKFLSLNGRMILSSIDIDVWRSIRSGLLASFELSLDLHYTVDDVELLIRNELTSNGAGELAPLMFEEVYQKLNFSVVDGELQVTSVGNSLESHIRAILEQELQPLHYSNIHALYEKRYGVTIAKRNIHARLGNFLLFGRGTYGVERHFKVTDMLAQQIIARTESYLGEQPEKQFHSQEILNSLLSDRVFDADALISKYVLSLILQKSDNISNLGKMIWILKTDESEHIERLQIKDLVCDALRAAGGPLHLHELKKIIGKVRDVSVYFEAHVIANELYSRVDPGTWGLLDRDFLLSSKEWSEIKDFLFDALYQADESFHISELLGPVADKISAVGITNYHVAGVLAVDGRFKRWRGNLFGLSVWNSPKRLTTSAAIDEVLSDCGAQLSYDFVYDEVRKKVSYQFAKSVISASLQKAGFTYDLEQNIWQRDMS